MKKLLSLVLGIAIVLLALPYLSSGTSVFMAKWAYDWGLPVPVVKLILLAVAAVILLLIFGLVKKAVVVLVIAVLVLRCVTYKSFITLINTSYSMKNEGDERDSGVLSNPLSFLRSGSFGWSFAGLSNRGGGGDYWSLRSANTTNSNNLYFSNTYLTPQNYSSRGNGLAVRCVS